MSAGPDEAGEDEKSTRWLRSSRVTPETGLGRRQLRGHRHKKLVGWRRQAGSEGRQGSVASEAAAWRRCDPGSGQVVLGAL